MPGKGVELFNRREIAHKYEIHTSHRQKFHLKNIVEILSTHGYNEISGKFVYDYF